MTKKEKYNAILELVNERHSKDQPILIGTTSVENSEIISKLFNKEKIRHNVLNAKFHHKEAEIITEAGSSWKCNYFNKYGWARYRYKTWWS